MGGMRGLPGQRFSFRNGLWAMRGREIQIWYQIYAVIARFRDMASLVLIWRRYDKFMQNF